MGNELGLGLSFKAVGFDFGSINVGSTLIITHSTTFIHVKKVKNEHLKYIIRFYNVKNFVKFFKGGFTIGTLDELYVASLNCR